MEVKDILNTLSKESVEKRMEILSACTVAQLKELANLIGDIHYTTKTKKADLISDILSSISVTQGAKQLCEEIVNLSDKQKEVIFAEEKFATKITPYKEPRVTKPKSEYINGIYVGAFIAFVTATEKCISAKVIEVMRENNIVSSVIAETKMGERYNVPACAIEWVRSPEGRWPKGIMLRFKRKRGV